MKVAVETPHQDEIAALLRQSDAVAAALYSRFIAIFRGCWFLLPAVHNYIARMRHRGLASMGKIVLEVVDTTARPQNL